MTTDRTIEIAREIADRLDAAGQHHEATEIRRLATTARHLWATAKVLYHDNMALRRGERIKQAPGPLRGDDEVQLRELLWQIGAIMEEPK